LHEPILLAPLRAVDWLLFRLKKAFATGQG
jgi:hypothetical protein